MLHDATALADAIRRGVLSAADAMQASLDAAARHDPLGAIVHLDSGMGMAAARAMDDQREADPARFASRVFGGVPTLGKDLGGPFAGFPVTAGSSLFEREAGDEDSDLAGRFRDTGFCLFGLTTSPEFGLSLASEPAIGPICRNPLDPSLRQVVPRVEQRPPLVPAWYQSPMPPMPAARSGCLPPVAAWWVSSRVVVRCPLDHPSAIILAGSPASWL